MIQPSLFDDQVPGKVGHAHPSTSHVAAKRLKSGTQHAAIVEALSKAAEGHTAYELYGSILNRGGQPIAVNQIATRLGELRERGYVKYLIGPGGETVTRPTTPGNSGLVQVLTEQGEAMLDGLR